MLRRKCKAVTTTCRLTNRGFSLTELLIVVAVILVLIALCIVAAEGLYAHGVRLQCQHRLGQLFQACRLFANVQDGRFPRSWDPVTRRRWYNTLTDYLDSPDVLACPSAADADGGLPDLDDRTSLPVLLYVLGINRDPKADLWNNWNALGAFRDWLADEEHKDVTGHAWAIPDNTAFAADFSDGHPTSSRITPELLDAYSQVWMFTTDRNGKYNKNGPAGTAYERGLFFEDELVALKAYHAGGGPLHVLSESIEDGRGTWLTSANQMLSYLGVGITAEEARISGSQHEYVSFQPYQGGVHPVLSGVARIGTITSPAKLRMTDAAAAAIGVDKDRGHCYVAAWESGTAGRVLEFGLFTALGNSGSGYGVGGRDLFDDDANSDHKRYCLNAAQWLLDGYRGIGQCSYGYNNQVGRTSGRTGNRTVLMMDYRCWEIDRDGSNPAYDDTDTDIALRHGGRTNVLFFDGRVQALRAEEITAEMWTPDPAN